MSEQRYKLVNGETIPMTPEEQAEFEAQEAKRTQSSNVASATLDMGKTMFEILNS